VNVNVHAHVHVLETANTRHGDHRASTQTCPTPTNLDPSSLSRASVLREGRAESGSEGVALLASLGAHPPVAQKHAELARRPSLYPRPTMHEGM
jgi:hypothetical protein